MSDEPGEWPSGRSQRSRLDRVRLMERTLIAELPQKLDEQVRIRGWVNALRDQKRVQFIVVRDETAMAQVVVPKGEEPSELNERISALTPESAVTIVGTVKADERVNLGGFEVKLEQLEVDSLAEPEVPIAPDSASTGTMWATGQKTLDERISQGPSSAINVPGQNLQNEHQAGRGIE